jgi:hypothetical protein
MERQSVEGRSRLLKVAAKRHFVRLSQAAPRTADSPTNPEHFQMQCTAVLQFLLNCTALWTCVSCKALPGVEYLAWDAFLFTYRSLFGLLNL